MANQDVLIKLNLWCNISTGDLVNRHMKAIMLLGSQCLNNVIRVQEQKLLVLVFEVVICHWMTKVYP